MRPQLVRCSDDQSFHLVDRLGAHLDCRSASYPKRADHAHAIVVSLGKASVTARQHGASSGFGVEGIGLAMCAPSPTVRTVDLCDTAAGSGEKACQASAVRACAFNAEGNVRVELA